MNDLVNRPSFYEGQIVSAGQLNGVVDHSRSGLARHERYLHSWGIAEGLELIGEERQTDGGDPYQEITLQPGLAVDGTGRQLLVTGPQRLSEDTFDQANVAISDGEAYYPVFISGRDQAQQQSESPLAACNNGGPSKIEEHVDVAFGRVEDAADPGNEEVDQVQDGPGGGVGVQPWRVLVGFVQWDSTIKRFVATQDSHDGVRRIYAGVRADDVTARGGTVTLRSAERGENGTAALSVSNDEGGLMLFGLQNSQGEVIPVFSVNAKGDLHAQGKITGAIAGGVQVQSGVAFDGATLPLPAGISQEQVDSGEVTIQAQVSPHYGEPALPSPTAGERWMMRPIECRVQGRRVLCRVRWEYTDPAIPVPVVELPGACDFTLLAFASEE
jgi:hypothetical protein